MVTVESLQPLRGRAIEMAAGETVGALRTRFAEAQRVGVGEPVDARVEDGEHSAECVRWRLIYDGKELENDRATLRSVGLMADAHVAAVKGRQIVGLQAHAFELLRRWWPLLVGALVLIVLYSMAFADPGVCDKPLALFVGVGAPLLLPYVGILCGAVQQELGYRLLWFWPRPWLFRLVCVNALCSFIWLCIGGRWVFGASSTCTLSAAQLYGASLGTWCLLLLVNAPWAIVIVTPCLAFCHVPCAFLTIAHMAGVHRYPENGYM